MAVVIPPTQLSCMMMTITIIQVVRVIKYIINSRVRGHYKVKGRDRQTLVFSATLAIQRRSTERKKEEVHLISRNHWSILVFHYLLLELLEMKPLPLHAQMQQRQRLKNLDRYGLTLILVYTLYIASVVTVLRRLQHSRKASYLAHSLRHNVFVQT